VRAREYLVAENWHAHADHELLCSKGPTNAAKVDELLSRCKDFFAVSKGHIFSIIFKNKLITHAKHGTKGALKNKILRVY
jgi:hypothetical protein